MRHHHSLGEHRRFSGLSDAQVVKAERAASARTATPRRCEEHARARCKRIDGVRVGRIAGTPAVILLEVARTELSERDHPTDDFMAGGTVVPTIELANTTSENLDESKVPGGRGVGGHTAV
jgi:hypothetical protein